MSVLAGAGGWPGAALVLGAGAAGGHHGAAGDPGLPGQVGRRGRQPGRHVRVRVSTLGLSPTATAVRTVDEPLILVVACGGCRCRVRRLRLTALAEDIARRIMRGEIRVGVPPMAGHLLRPLSAHQATSRAPWPPSTSLGLPACLSASGGPPYWPHRAAALLHPAAEAIPRRPPVAALGAAWGWCGAAGAGGGLGRDELPAAQGHVHAHARPARRTAGATTTTANGWRLRRKHRRG